MGALPKRRISTSRQRKRRGPKKVKIGKLVNCQNCHQKKMPHQACPHCGYYKGEKVVDIKEKEKK